MASASFSILILNDVLVHNIYNFRAPVEHGFSFFQVKMFTGSVSVLLTSISLKITLLKLAEATRETEHRSAMHSAPSTEV